MDVSPKIFEHIVETYILPLIPIAKRGKIIYNSNYSFPLDQKKNIQVCNSTDEKGGTVYNLFIAPPYLPHSFYYVSRLSCAFNSFKIINTVLNEIFSSLRGFAYDAGDDRFPFYIDTICNEATMLGICQTVTANVTEATLIGSIIRVLSNWSLRAYEGRKVPFGIIVDFNEPESELYTNNYLSFLNSKNSAVFTDGVYSAILLNCKGNIVSHLCLRDKPQKKAKQSPRSSSLSPSRFANFSSLCKKNMVGIMLLTNGDILIFRMAQLQFARREGQWQTYNYSTYIRPCFEYLFDFELNSKKPRVSEAIEDLAKCVYITMLDVSFAHTGACLAILDFKKNAEKIEEILDIGLIEKELGSQINERFSSTQCDQLLQKQAIIRQLVNYRRTERGELRTKRIYELENKLRTELLSLDGATVLDKLGHIRAVGAILSVKPGSEEGGRMAAARTLSQYGFAAKISEDGAIIGIYKGVEYFRIG